MPHKKQQSDFYTPIHNDVLEALMRVNLSPYEVRVLFAVWRKTYGFIDRTTGRRRKSDRIPISQLEDLTGLDRRNIGRALIGLQKKAIISRDDSGTTGLDKSFMRTMPRQISQPVAPFTEAVKKHEEARESGDMVSMEEILKQRPPF